LKRAVRSKNFLTLVTVEARREWEGMMVPADDGTLQEVAQIIGREVRDTDFLGHTGTGTLALVLDVDFEHSSRVIDRVVSRIENYEFQNALRIAVRAACCDACGRRRIPEAPGPVAAARERAGGRHFI
jgi:hypothetical protein